MAKPTRLKNLVIREVSSVDRGAGEDCRVLFHKLEDDDHGSARQLLNASIALQTSISSIFDDDTLDVQARDLALKESFEQYRVHCAALTAAAAAENDGEEIDDEPAAKFLTFDDCRAARAAAEEDDDAEDDDDNVVTLADKRHGDAWRYLRRQRRKKPEPAAAADTTKGQSMDILQIAKHVNAGEAPGAVTKRDFYSAIVEIGEEIRKTSAAAGKPISTEVAFTRAMMTPEGSCLYRASRRAPGLETDRAGPAPAQRVAPAPSPSLTRLNELAEAARKADPTLTRDGAFAKIYTDPRFAELANAERRERRAMAV